MLRSGALVLILTLVVGGCSKGSPTAPAQVAAPAPQQQPQPPVNVQILSIEAMWIDRDGAFWELSWKVRVSNASQRDLVCDLDVQFQDAGGFALDRDFLFDEPVPQGESDHSDTLLIDAAQGPNVAQALATIAC